MLNKEDFIMHTPAPIGYMIRKLEEEGFECFLVGGSVRDSIMEIVPKDYDLATNCEMEKLKEIFSDFKVINANGEKHNTVTFRTNSLNLEFTTYRDLKGNSKDKLTDLYYRDFTINAIMYSPIHGLYDPYNGYDDIKNRILRSPGKAIDRLNEDPVRILRALRFSLKYGLDISDELNDAIYESKDGLDRVSVERIKSELDSILVLDGTSDVIYKYRDIFTKIIPELSVMFDFDQLSKYHKNDLFTHTLNVFKSVDNIPTLKMASLLHDIGKPNTQTFRGNKEGDIVAHYYSHPKESEQIATGILERLRYSKKETKEILFYIRNHELDDYLTKKAIRRLLKDMPFKDPILVRNLFNLRKADSMDHLIGSFDTISANILLDQVLKEEECLSVNDVKLNGFDLNKLGFYKRDVGKMKHVLLELILNEEVENTKEDLVDAIKSGKAKILKETNE